MRISLRNVVSLIGLSVLILTPASVAQKVGDFVFVRNIDLITDEDISYFYTKVINSESDDSKLIFTCAGGKPSIYVESDRVVGYYNDKSIITRIRFDTNTPSGNLEWPHSKGGYRINVPVSQISAFTASAVKADQLVIQATRHYNDGEQIQYQFGVTKLSTLLPKLACGKLFK